MIETEVKKVEKPGVNSVPKEYYKILLVGGTGKGKTYSMKDLDPKTTGFINMENKPLPFKTKFTNHLRPTRFQDAYKALIDYGTNPDIDTIVIDSFSAYTDRILAEARKTKKGFDIWSMYNEEIGLFLDMVKRVPKHVIITAHYEILGIEGAQEKRVKVKAKEWEGQVEKEFTMVLYLDSKIDSKTGLPEYFFNAYQEGASAKCPPDLLGKGVLKIENNCAVVLEKVNQFVNN